tara:strand:+ start:126 stop:506 length:381 start_codon:yes stop_codon:yes gene_type:complete
MSIKVVKLKSGEDLVAEVSEIQHKDTGVRQAFVLNKAYKITIEKQFVDGTEERQQQYTGRILLEKWQPLTHDEDIAIIPDWVVSIVEPIMSVLEAYGQTLKPSEEAKAVFGSDVNTEPNIEIVDDK